MLKSIFTVNVMTYVLTARSYILYQLTQLTAKFFASEFLSAAECFRSKIILCPRVQIVITELQRKTKSICAIIFLVDVVRHRLLVCTILPSCGLLCKSSVK